MRNAILIGLIVFMLFLGSKGYTYFNKYRHAKRLKVYVGDFRFPKLNLASLVSDIMAAVRINIDNYSPSSFTLEQINVDVYSPSGMLVAEQTAPLRQSLTIRPNGTTLLPLSFLLSAPKVVQLIKEAGGAVKVGANFLSSGSYGIPLHLKGFVTAEGFTLDIDEKVLV